MRHDYHTGLNVSELAKVIHPRCSAFQVVMDKVVEHLEGKRHPGFMDGRQKEL